MKNLNVGCWTECFFRVDIREYRLEMMLRKVPEDVAEDGGILQFKETLGKDEVTPRFGGVTL